MPQIQVVDQGANPVSVRELNAAVFGLEADDGFIHRVYAALSLAQRFGNHATKTRREVSGGGKKPWKQKGTGRARQGSTRAAQWRHGGTAHGPQPHGYETRINKKERRRALCLALSSHVRNGTLTVLDKIELAEVRTKSFVSAMQGLKVESGLIVVGSPSRTVDLSARNVPNVKVVLDGQMNLHDLLKYDRLVLTEESVAKIEERLA